MTSLALLGSRFPRRGLTLSAVPLQVLTRALSKLVLEHVEIGLYGPGSLDPSSLTSLKIRSCTGSAAFLMRLVNRFKTPGFISR